DLADSEARYRRILETTLEGVWTLDAEDVTTFANPALAEILDTEPEAMIGRPLTDFGLGDADPPRGRHHGLAPPGGPPPRGGGPARVGARGRQPDGRTGGELLRCAGDGHRHHRPQGDGGAPAAPGRPRPPDRDLQPPAPARGARRAAADGRAHRARRGGAGHG